MIPSTLRNFNMGFNLDFDMIYLVNVGEEIEKGEFNVQFLENDSIWN